MPGASLSKWPAAVMISGLVADGIMSYDDRANKFLPWWATDPSDPRSNVTLRHLLSFTSGFTEDGFTICSRVDAAFVQCAEALYKVHADRSAHRHGATARRVMRTVPLPGFYFTPGIHEVSEARHNLGVPELPSAVCGGDGR